MTYVDGFLLAVPKSKLGAYKQMAQDASRVWKKYGALAYYECTGDDLSPPHASLHFDKLVKAKRGEVTILSFVVYKSKSQRDYVNKKVMSDPFMKKYESKPMPFDMKRMGFGGFKVLVEA